MDVKLILSEIKSEGLKEIVNSLNELLLTNDKTQEENKIFLMVHKFMIQSIALDWLYNRYRDRIKEK